MIIDYHGMKCRYGTYANNPMLTLVDPADWGKSHQYDFYEPHFGLWCHFLTKEEMKELIYKEKYKFISENTTGLLSLHDCDCSHFYYQNDSLVFEMEWMEILANHPQNPNSKAYQSGGGMIILESAQLIECILNQKNAGGEVSVERRITDIEEINFRDTEILAYNEMRTAGGFEAKMYMDFYEKDSSFNSIVLEVQFQKSIVMWNELDDVSWFEDGEEQQADSK